MSVSVDSRFLVAMPLTQEHLEDLLASIAAAASVGELLQVAIGGVFEPLLAACGKSFTDFGPAHQLDPTRFAIPQVQWSALMQTLTSRADEWGMGAHVAVEIANVFPSTYDDPDVPAPVVPATDYRPETVAVSVSRSAAGTIAAIEAYLDQLAAFYGGRSAEFVTALRSWHRHLAALFTARIGESIALTADGQRSLLVSSNALTYGLVYHGGAPVCAVPGCAAIFRNDRWVGPYSATPDHEHALSDDDGGIPRPGTWSVHS